MFKHHIEELNHLAHQINHNSRLVTEAGVWARPDEGDCAPWIKPLECYFNTKPALKRLGINEQENEFKLKITAAPLTPGGSMRVANKVVDVSGNGSYLAKELD
jgi:hypothetical protein